VRPTRHQIAVAAFSLGFMFLLASFWYPPVPESNASVYLALMLSSALAYFVGSSFALPKKGQAEYALLERFFRLGRVFVVAIALFGLSLIFLISLLSMVL